ncbi:MAG: hypothetical protein ACYSTW_09985 [Planctomycetota bacterium]|jgi:hypothetical protein
MRFFCLHCKDTISIDGALAGKDIQCKHCGKTTSVPFKDDYSRLFPEENTIQASSNYLKTRRNLILKYMDSHVVFSEVSVWVMSFSLLFLLLCNRDLQRDIFRIIGSITSGLYTVDIHAITIKYVILFIVFLMPIAFCIIAPPVAGIYLSLVHAFRTNPKTELEKTCIFLFAIYLNLLAGGVCGYHLLVDAFMSKWWYLLMILPLWNWTSCILLLIKLDHQSKRNDLGEMVSDDDASLIEIAITVLACITVVAVTQFGLGLHWSIILSMCVVYATSFCKSWRVTIASDKILSEHEEVGL